MPDDQNYNRREFLGSSAASAAGMAAGVMGLGVSPAARGVESLHLGIIGLGQQGLHLAEIFAGQPDVRIVSVCDVDVRALGKGLERIETLTGRRPEASSHYESLLDRADLDAVVIATPDHWHARIAVDACRAGKDIYVEQPLGVCIEDGRMMCAAAEQSGCVVQTGLPQRSGEHFQSAVELLRRRELGAVQLAKAWAVHKRRSIASCATSAPPQGVDYDRWLGPAPQRAFQANRFHQNWPWFWDYGSGELGLWGVHLLDVVRWGLDLQSPSRVAASGGKRFFRDDRETPDTLAVQYQFGDVTVLWEHRQWSRHGIEGRTAAAAFYGDKGTLIIDRSGWKVYDRSESLYAGAGEIHRAHVRNFIEAVRVRSTPAADIHSGHQTASLCHLGNVAWRVGHEISVDPATGEILSDPLAQALTRRECRSPWQIG